MKTRLLVYSLLLLAAWGLLAGCTLPVAMTPVPSAQETPSAAPAEDVSAATTDQETYKGIPVGFTEEGYPYRGNPDAPVTVYEFSDFQCPFCARHVMQTEPALLDTVVAEGQARFVFRDFPLESLHPNAIPAAIAANCVAQQGPVLFWKMHDLLFRTQDEWGPMEDPTEFFARLAQDAGADPEAFAACMAEQADAIREQVLASVDEAQSYGFSGTPTFRFVNEATGEHYDLVGAQPYNVFTDWVEAIAAGQAPPDQSQAEQQGEPQIPFWATREGLTPDPDNPGYTMAGDQWRGDPEAPLVVVEFSDFQCPFCRQHTLNTQPVLDEQFIDTGKVMWVFKHFPIKNIHPQAIPASIAAECAARQGKFWEMHDRLFETQDEWAQGDADTVFTRLAEELGLDVEAFNACRADEQIFEIVRSDLEDGAPFVRGTPTFVVLWGQEGRLIPGALPADQFTQALDQMYAAATGEQ